MTLLFVFACVPTEVVNGEPTVVITGPDQSEEIRAGVPFQVVATVDDDAGAGGLDLAWAVSPEPETEGNGLLTDDEASYYLDNGLARGDWEIQLTATDYAGLSDFDTLKLTILDNDRPRVRIQLPQSEETYDDADPLIVQVQVDPRDDEMSNIELSWGGVAKNAAEAPTYAPNEGLVIFKIEDLDKGDAEITVTARDGGGEEDSDSVSFTLR